jgi:hypothetical protein
LAKSRLTDYLQILADGPPQPAGGTEKGPIMLYHLNRGLFVENGPTVLADRAREALATTLAYRLADAARPAARPAPEAATCSAAA